MNSYSENATKGLIKKIISRGSLDKATTFVLANALYFKGAWATGSDFPEILTKK